MQKQTIQLGYGKANLSNTLATYACMRVSAPFNRVTAVTSGERIGRSNARLVGGHEIHGVLVSQSVQHENGAIILLTASWKRGGGSIRDGSIFLRLRHGAPMHNIVAYVPTGHENICGDRFIMFSGMADIMNIEELQAVGIEVNRSYASKYMEMEEIDECFEIQQLARATIERPVMTPISTVDGIQLREVAQAPGRRLLLRRGG